MEQCTRGWRQLTSKRGTLVIFSCRSIGSRRPEEGPKECCCPPGHLTCSTISRTVQGPEESKICQRNQPRDMIHCLLLLQALCFSDTPGQANHCSLTAVGSLLLCLACVKLSLVIQGMQHAERTSSGGSGLDHQWELAIGNINMDMNINYLLSKVLAAYFQAMIVNILVV